MHVGKLRVGSIRVTNILTAWLICSVYIKNNIMLVSGKAYIFRLQQTINAKTQSILIHPLGISDGVNMNMFLIVDTGNYALGL